MENNDPDESAPHKFKRLISAFVNDGVVTLEAQFSNGSIGLLDVDVADVGRVIEALLANADRLGRHHIPATTRLADRSRPTAELRPDEIEAQATSARVQLVARVGLIDLVISLPPQKAIGLASRIHQEAQKLAARNNWKG